MVFFEYRSLARFLAIIDSVFSSLALLLVSIALIFQLTTLFKGPCSRNSQNDDQVWKQAVVIALVFFFFLLAIQLWAAVMFLIATKKEADYVEAVKRAWIWRNVNVALLLLPFSIILTRFYRVGPLELCVLLFRAYILLNIGKFIKELDEAVATSVIGNQDGCER